MVNRLRAVTAVLLLFLAVADGDARPDAPPTGSQSPSPAMVTPGLSGLGELLVPSRTSTVTAGWIDPTSAKGRPLPHPAVVATVADLLLMLVAVVRRRPGPPWHDQFRHSAVLRAPPLLLHP